MAAVVLFILCVGVCVMICYIFFIVYIYTVLRVMIYEVCYQWVLYTTLISVNAVLDRYDIVFLHRKF